MDETDSKLRRLIESCDDCQQRFSEAESLAKSIFSRERHSKIVPLPYYTEHGSTHCGAVEKYLNEIIWQRKEMSRYDFIPNEEEAMYLLSATQLHDIGMWYGLWDDEKPEDLDDDEKVIELRKEHEERTARYIQKKWSDAINWTKDQKDYLSSICFYHRSKHPISTLGPAIISGHHGDVRPTVLASLLRLADAWHVDESRTPPILENLYISLGMGQEAREHWSKAGLIRGVEKDEKDVSNKKIRVTGHYPVEHKFRLGRFDLADVGETVREDILVELHSVRQILSQYPNTSFADVKHDAQHMKVLEARAKEQYLALWPYLLNKLTSSTEVTAALVEVLLFAAERGVDNWKKKKPWRKKILEIVDRVQDSHRFDFMITNLCEDVKIRIGRKRTLAEELITYLKHVKKRITDNFNKMAAHAVHIINDEDCLIVYGHSTNTLRLIEEVPQKQDRDLYIVECFRGTNTYLKENEDKKIKNRVLALGFENVRFVHFHAFAQALGELAQKEQVCKFLLGTHGVVRELDENNEVVTQKFICKTGSNIVATMANKSAVAEVIVFADKEKILRNGLSANDIAGLHKTFSWENGPQHLELRIPYLPPIMDIVPDSVLDYYISEGGVFDAKTAQLVGRQASGKKASSPR